MRNATLRLNFNLLEGGGGGGRVKEGILPSILPYGEMFFEKTSFSIYLLSLKLSIFLILFTNMTLSTLVLAVCRTHVI